MQAQRNMRIVNRPVAVTNRCAKRQNSPVSLFADSDTGYKYLFSNLLTLPAATSIGGNTTGMMSLSTHGVARAVKRELLGTKPSRIIHSSANSVLLVHCGVTRHRALLQELLWPVFLFWSSEPAAHDIWGIHDRWRSINFSTRMLSKSRSGSPIVGAPLHVSQPSLSFSFFFFPSRSRSSVFL